jgi:2-amino-4-hydroxy-6-hydroxymethyldihydropteridine diphosphokinase
LLFYGGLVLQTPTLTLPHPALSERRFVLIPLAEIAPHWRHPISGKTAEEMLAELQKESGDDLPAVRRITNTLQSS